MNKSSFKARGGGGGGPNVGINNAMHNNMRPANTGNIAAGGMMRQQHNNNNQNAPQMMQQMNPAQQAQMQQQYAQQQHQYAQQQQQQQQQQYYQQQQQMQQQMSQQQQQGGPANMPQQQMMNGGGIMNNAQIQQLNQKNHRLAKELSDLRVRHREETKVVSRLTMENMNLASRCREAISQVAALKKEVLVYQKRESEWGTLQKEVMQLRKTINKNASSSSSNNATSPKNALLSNGSANKKQTPTIGGGNNNAAGTSSNNNLENNDRSDSPATDLDRIMSRQFRKQDKSSTNNSGSANKNLTKGGESTTTTKNSATKTTSPTAVGAVANKATNKLASANTKIPISMVSSKSKTTTERKNSTSSAASSQKDDEFDADIDMVDFFAKSQTLMNNNNTTNNESSESPSPLGSSHLGSRKSYTRKPKSTDDHMPSNVISVVSPTPGPGTANSATGKKSPSDNLLSSLDAFEASFASAFPETSFSITSNITTPSSSGHKLDMSFDVPEFDPFFKSPNNNNKLGDNNKDANISGKGGNNTGVKSQTMQDLFPESAMNFKSSTSPKFDSTLSSSSGMGFTPTSSGMGFTPIDKNKKGGAGVSSTTTSNKTSPEKLDKSFSRVQSKGGKKDDSSKPKRGVGNTTTLSPHTMSAEIEQLDAIANSTSSQNENTANSSSGVDATLSNARAGLRAVRKVKQPVSYAEPSTKSKLRRGDVLFPKVDASDKNKVTGGGGAPASSTSPSSGLADLDRIMDKIKSSDGGQ